VLRESAQEPLALAEFFHSKLPKVRVFELVEDFIRDALLRKFGCEVFKMFGFQYGGEFFFHNSIVKGWGGFVSGVMPYRDRLPQQNSPRRKACDVVADAGSLGIS
jgi:hypothetical protein